MTYYILAHFILCRLLHYFGGNSQIAQFDDTSAHPIVWCCIKIIVNICVIFQKTKCFNHSFQNLKFCVHSVCNPNFAQLPWLALFLYPIRIWHPINQNSPIMLPGLLHQVNRSEKLILRVLTGWTFVIHVGRGSFCCRYPGVLEDSLITWTRSARVRFDTIART